MAKIKLGREPNRKRPSKVDIVRWRASGNSGSSLWEMGDRGISRLMGLRSLMLLPRTGTTGLRAR
jgi:hypothetical protein